MKMNNTSYNLAAQSTYFKLKRSTSKDSGIFLDNTVYEMLVPYFSGKDEKGHDTIDLLIFKEDCIKALANIMCSLPLFSSVAGVPKEENNAVEIYLSLSKQISDFFGENDSAVLSSLYFTDLQGRKYLWGTEGKRRPFELRKFFIANHTELFFNTEKGSPVILRFKTHIVSENKEEFEPLKVEAVPSIIETPRQIIWYGAPGTGKSFTVNKETNKANSVRTTFHPDTDYASFVGTYKPTLQPVKPMYHNIQGREEEISYKFVPQVFLKAYVAAWKNYVENPEGPKPYYLVIEEINRGNCAQIFGDLFQLLDREEDGTSTHEIVPDTDIEKFLRDDERGFADVAEIEEFSADIKNGKILKLPSNLYIYATMNTSDQSLFPIDSAFKRRWEWRYTPIAKPTSKNWTISANGKTWSWWKFLERINFEIGKATESEDKKLGYFFARAKKTDPADIDNNNGVIDASTFVSKVLFYLWNDVIKDNDFNGDLLRDKNGKQLDFTRFFKIVNGKTVPDEELVEQFIENVMRVELPGEDKKAEETTEQPTDETIEDENNN